MHFRTLAALLLSTLLTAVSYSQPTPKEQPKDKEPSKGPTKLPEAKYPKEINGKDMDAWLKLLTDTDPALREMALHTLPNFGPDLRAKASAKQLIARMRTEPDPGVKIALFNLVGSMAFESEADNKEAIRILGTAANESGSIIRLHALQALTQFGHKAHDVAYLLIGPPVLDPSYEIRRMTAHTLGRIAYSEKEGPHPKALSVLSGNLAKDPCTAVRLEALQSLVLLGPPMEPRKEGEKGPLKIDVKNTELHVTNMKNRIGTAKVKATENDKQIALWCRLVMMRFDARETNDENLNAIVQPLTSSELAVKLQALQVLSLIGEGAAKKIDAVIALLTDKEQPLQVSALHALASMGEKAGPSCPAVLKLLNDEKVPPAVLLGTLNALAAMGVAGRPALPDLDKLLVRLETLRLKRIGDMDFKKEFDTLKPEDQKFVLDHLPEEQFKKAVHETIKYINDSKLGHPGGIPASGSEPKKP